MKRQLTSIIFLTVLNCSLFGCTGDFLEKKPQKSLLIPESLSDLQALLDNSRDLMNVTPYLPLISDGDFQISEPVLQSQPQMTQSSYIWADDVHNELADWDLPFKQIFYSNIVLDGLGKIKPDDSQNAQFNNLKGSALFFRALAFYNLAQQFSTQYEAKTANESPGIPLGLKADINQILPRNSLAQTYERIIQDLLTAEPLLEIAQLYLTRPSKPAVQALLAKIFLSMGDYEKALSYVGASLTTKNELLDYNTLSAASAIPFPLPLINRNPEVLFYSRVNSSIFDNAGVIADTSLLNSYQQSDLRRRLYFNSLGNYKGSYTGSVNPFSGLTTSELYLIQAECQARQGQTTLALNTLNKLLENRWEKGNFKKLTASSNAEVLSIILKERRKEMVGRASRWHDLRRLNMEPAYARELVRNVSGIIYKLAPNDKRYTFKIPADQISGSGIQQNP
jgi:hypothetical protein